MNRKLFVALTLACAAFLSACYDKEDIDAFKNQYKPKTQTAQTVQTAAQTSATQTTAAAAAAPQADYPVAAPGTVVQTDAFWQQDDNFKDPLVDRYSYFPPFVGVNSYPAVRKTISLGQRPAASIVQNEEIINYFPYNYPAPGMYSQDPAVMIAEYTDCPWNRDHKLVKIGVTAKDPGRQNAPPQNLVFLLDISGSMGAPNKLDLVKQSFPYLLAQLRPQDTVSVVTYAKDVQVPLEGLNGGQREQVMQTVAALQSGGRTAGAAGITQAYATAHKYFLTNGINRVILATDGYFNIGPSSIADLEGQIAKEQQGGISLSVLAYGTGALKDPHMQSLADKGQGTYDFIDNVKDAELVWRREFGTSKTIVARDVSFKVEINPVKVQSYRLIGYKRKSNNFISPSAKGDLYAGQQITAIYEIVPRCVTCADGTAPKDSVYNDAGPRCQREILTSKMIYTDPITGTQTYLETPVNIASYVTFDTASEDTRFAAAAAQFGQILENNQNRGTMTMEDVIRAASGAKYYDPGALRTDFVNTAINYTNLK